MTDAEVDAETGDANLRHNHPSTTLQVRCDGFFKRRIETAYRAAVLGGQRDRAALRIVEESLQVIDCKRLGPAGRWLEP